MDGWMTRRTSFANLTIFLDLLAIFLEVLYGLSLPSEVSCDLRLLLEVPYGLWLHLEIAHGLLPLRCVVDCSPAIL